MGITFFSLNNYADLLDIIEERYSDVLVGSSEELLTTSKTLIGAINEIKTALDNYQSNTLTSINVTYTLSNRVYTFVANPIPTNADYNGVNWSSTVGIGAEDINSNSFTLTPSSNNWRDKAIVTAVSKDNSSIIITKEVYLSSTATFDLVCDSTIEENGTARVVCSPDKLDDSKTVTWSVNNSNVSINSNGAITVSENTNNESATITATVSYIDESGNNATKVLTKTITVNNMPSTSAETLLFEYDNWKSGNMSTSSYTNKVMAQNSGLTEWTIMLKANCNNVSAASVWIDDGISSTSQMPQNVQGGIALVNYAWGAAKFSLYVGGSWVEGSAYNPGDNNNITYIITRSGNTVKYSKNGTTWTTISVSKWNTGSNNLTIGQTASKSNAVDSGGKMIFRLYDTSEVSQDTINNFLNY